MRDNVRAFVEIAARSFDLGGPVYEFGSYLVEEQEYTADLRSVFADHQFVGCDLRPGPGVDRVEDLARLTLRDETARTIICVDTLEHVFEARRAVDEMVRVLAPGGALLLAAPMDFRIHDYPSDYWRLTPSCLERLLAPLDAALVGWQGMDSHPHTVFGIGFKGPLAAQLLPGFNTMISRYQAWLASVENAIPWHERLKRLLTAPLRSKGDRRRSREFHQARFSLHMSNSRGWSDAITAVKSRDDRTSARLDRT